MADTYQSYKAFISSPSDVKIERQMAEESIRCINRSCIETLRLSLEVKRWENLPAQSPHIPEEQIQDILNRLVEKSNFFILILYKRYGTIEKGYSISNTEREINTILKRYEKKPQIKILAYFRDIPPNKDPGEQEQKVIDLKNRLQSIGIFFKQYAKPEEFRDLLTHDLYDVILRMRLSSFKHFYLNNFWKFGNSERPTHPRLAIVYPSVQREYMGNPDNKELWIKRLEPNIYFEDFKAIQKLHKVFNLIGFTDYRIYQHTDLPADIKYMNRIWLCFPRLRPAQEQLKKYSKVSRFSFIPRTGNRNGAILWSNRKKNQIKIRSPLARYLKEQRGKMDTSGEWHSQLGNIIAKDYAIIARFNDVEHQDVSTEECLQDFFLAGIRGLGTWGAAWYLDRKYKHLPKKSSDENIQILIEVTFRNDRIFDMRDVSREPPEYFSNENNIRTIRRNIKAFSESRHIY